MASRLVGNGSGFNGSQAGALWEGLSDFVALLATVRAEDVGVAANASWSGTYAMSAYVDNGADTIGAYFGGGRRYPYTADLTKNPLTFKHIQDTATLPTDVPLQPLWDPTMSEVHAAGEVSGLMLWECYAALLRDSTRLTFEEAQSRMKRYLVAALKLTPPSPTYLEVRNGFLAAAMASDDKDYALFLAAFAKRGAGVGAVAPERNAWGNPGVIESFVTKGTNFEVVSSTLVDDVVSCDRDGILDDGETGKLVVTIKNTEFSDLTGATAIVTCACPVSPSRMEGRSRFQRRRPFRPSRRAST